MVEVTGVFNHRSIACDLPRSLRRSTVTVSDLHSSRMTLGRSSAITEFDDMVTRVNLIVSSIWTVVKGHHLNSVGKDAGWQNARGV